MPPKTGPKVLIFGKGGISEGIKDALPRSEVVALSQESCDVTDGNQVWWMLENRHNMGNDPDWVVNCAGIDEEGFLCGADTIDTNLIGSYFVAEQCVKRGIPCILIASVAGLYGKPAHAAYCASKAGVISLVQSWGFDHDIWAISPGRVDTPMREARYPNDTPGSRLSPLQIGAVVRDIMDGKYESGTNVIIRKQGLHEVIIEEHKGDGWKERLRVGEPVTI